MLSIKNIVVHYGGVQALKGISLEISEGSITCLIGANGAGKSTTLKAISGMVPLSRGEIRFQGRRIDGLEPQEIVELGIGHVPEGKKLFLEMNVRDNLLSGAYLRRDNHRIQEDLKRICRFFPVLETAFNRPAANMSGGEQQMLAIGRGLMGAPKLLLLDEPSLGLSPLLTQEVGRIIKQIADEGVPILLIEQNAGLALSLAQKCFVLETGSIVLEGTGSELQNNKYIKEAYLGLEAEPSTATVKSQDRQISAQHVQPASDDNLVYGSQTAPATSDTRLFDASDKTVKAPGHNQQTVPRRLDKIHLNMRPATLAAAAQEDFKAASRPAGRSSDRHDLPAPAGETPAMRPAGKIRGAVRVVKRVFTPRCSD